MLFNSFSFLIFLVIVFIIYYIKPLAKYQVTILVLASLFFYAYSEPALLTLLLFSALINILISYYVAYGNRKWIRQWVTLGVAINLLGILFFKYNRLVFAPLSEGSDIARFIINIPLPIGISFFTFEGISLLIDVFRQKEAENKKMIPASFGIHAQRTLFFISFFPHLVSGPILKAHDFYPQIEKKKIFDIEWEQVFKNLVLGYFLKMVVADNLKDFTFWIAYPYFESVSSINLIVMLFGYSFQIFADFAGYSLIAIGLANLFGYRFQDNFNFPYIASSFKDFWKRWHISLSTFLMEYLYFPLGGNKKGKARTYFNLMLTMVLGGLWHGAALSYAVWGAFHGLALAIERLVSDKVQIRMNFLFLIVKSLFVFCFVTMAWLLFKLPDFNEVIKYFQSIARNQDVKVSHAQIVYITLYSSPVLLYHFAYLVKSRVNISFRKSEFVYYALMLFLIVTNSGSAGSFIYFQF